MAKKTKPVEVVEETPVVKSEKEILTELLESMNFYGINRKSELEAKIALL